MNVLGLVPARGGSKGVPRKNIRLLGGKPLLQYTAEAALASKRLTRVVLSTEDQEIADVGRKCGLDIPFMRPLELAQDSTPTLSVIQYVLHQLSEQGEWYDAVCLLQPTCPLRTVQMIDNCIDLFDNHQADSVISVSRLPDKYNPHWVYLEDNNGYLHISTGESNPISRRQDLPPAFSRDGSVYISKTKIIVEDNTLYGNKVVGYLVEPSLTLNIDTLDDWEKAENIFGNFRL